MHFCTVFIQKSSSINVGLYLYRHMMRVRFLIILILLFFIPFPGLLKVSAQVQQSRILILLDGSSSMINKWDGDLTRFKAAGDIILKLIDSVYKVNKDVEFSLRVYGHQHTVSENDCHDTRNEVMFSKDNIPKCSFDWLTCNLWV